MLKIRLILLCCQDCYTIPWRNFEKNLLGPPIPPSFISTFNFARLPKKIYLSVSGEGGAKMATGSESKVLQFVPFHSSLDPGFWHELGKRKLEQYQLSEEPVNIFGCYTNSRAIPTPFLSLDYCAFNEDPQLSTVDFSAPGVLRNTNTIASFMSSDKKSLLESAGSKIWDAINSGSALVDTSVLCSFLLLTFSDLKKYNYHYWFAYPALVPDDPITYKSINPIDKIYDTNALVNLQKSYDSFQRQSRNCGFFFVVKNGDEFSLKPLTAFEEVFQSSTANVMIGFCDPSTLDTNPGWPLRNFLILVSQTWSDKLRQVDVLCYRDRTHDGRRSIGHALMIEGVVLPGKRNSASLPKVTGWERNENNKISSRFVNLSSNMDPIRLSESAVDLNLKLMRWRILPSLQLDTIRNTKCLLLGAGTLGCNVARCLLGWGVRNITLVDNSRVSYSNPVRQSLFSFKDCVDGGVKKAGAAAESLRGIFPGVSAEGVELSIPMPGHSIGTDPGGVEEVRAAVDKLEEMIKSHDVVFLLMDTRESRWLPTLLSAIHSKICINAALGFDTFMVMRHGYLSPTADPKPCPVDHLPGSQLGCYFCNDVVAPTDSTRDRTLDQQCTVSRPGLSMIAGALAVELLSSILQHPDRGLAPADCNPDQDDTNTQCVLGLVPHQIRGFLSRFQNVLPASERFDKCTACSDVVLKEYREKGFEFLCKVFNSSNYLEDLTGLSQLYADTLDDHVWELSDDESI